MTLKRILIGISLSAAWAAHADTGKPGGEVYREVCAACHGMKVPTAPQLGDREAWAKLIKEGQIILTADGWVGVRAMPARGGKPDLSLAEFSRAVAYMAREAGAKWQDPDAAMLAKIRSRIAQREKTKK
jgi:cytochrome c5